MGQQYFIGVPSPFTIFYKIFNRSNYFVSNVKIKILISNISSLKLVDYFIKFQNASHLRLEILHFFLLFQNFHRQPELFLSDNVW